MIEFLKKWWFFIVDEVLQYVDMLNNDRLSKIANLLAIFLMALGFVEHLFRKKRKRIIDKIALSTKPNKAIDALDNPLGKGEETAMLLEDLAKGGKKAMENLNKFWQKFRGYLSATCLFILYVANYFGGFFDVWFQNELAGKIIAWVVLGASVITFALSNSFTKEQWKNIKQVAKGAVVNTSGKLDENARKTIKNALKNAKIVLKAASAKVDLLETELAKAKEDLTSQETLAKVLKQDTNSEDIQILKNIVTDKYENLAKAKQNLELAQETVNSLEEALNA